MSKVANLETKTAAFQRILQIMDELRAKCPWDRKQTLATLRPLTIEETYELADAITDGDLEGVKEEVGDLFLHLVFYAKIGEEKGVFDISTIINDLCEKMIHRHPHIYSNITVKDEEEVKRNWEALKLKEGKKSVLQGVPKSLPAVVKAVRIQEKVKQVGFEWENKTQVWAKVVEEMDELQEEVAANNREEMEKEFGDVLFSLINYARFLNIDPENALEKTNKKFITRFQEMEKTADKNGQNLQQLTLEEMDDMWNVIKKDVRFS